MRLLDIHREERLKVFLAWALNGLLATGHATGWAAMHALLVKRMGVGAMPFAYIFANLLGLLSSFVYLRFADAVRRDHALERSALILGVMLVGAWYLIIGPGSENVVLAPGVHDYRWALVLFFAMGVAAHGVGKSTLKAQTWTIFNDIFRPSQGRRLYPLIHTAKALGGLAGGLLVAPITMFFGLPGCVLAWAISVLLVLPMSWVIVHYFGAELQGGKSRPSARAEPGAHDETPPSLREGVRYCVTSPLVGLLALLALAFWICNQLHDFQYTQIMNLTFSDEKQLGRWFGYYTAGFNVACLLMQVFIAPRMLSWLGVGRSLLLQPLAGLAGFSAVLMSFTFLPGMFLRAAWDLMDDTLQHSSFQLSFNAVPSGWRGRARGFVDGVVNPIGGMLGGGVILALQWLGGIAVGRSATLWDYHVMTLVGLGFSALYLLLATRVRHVYVQAALTNLDQRPDHRTVVDSVEALEERGHPKALERLEHLASRGEFELQRIALRCLARLHYAPTFGHITRLLGDPNPALRETALHAARSFHHAVARKHPQQWTGLLRQAGDILAHDDAANVRAEAARLLLETADGLRATALIRDLLDDDTAEVRIRVVSTLATLRLPGIEDSLRPYLNDQRPAVRAATAAALWRGSRAAQAAAETTLATLLKSSDPADLCAGLGAAACLPTVAFAPDFTRLMEQSDPAVSTLAAMAFLGTGLARDAAWPRAVDLLSTALTDAAREPLLRTHLVPLFAELPADALDALLAGAAKLSPGHRAQAQCVLHELYPALLKTLAPPV